MCKRCGLNIVPGITIITPRAMQAVIEHPDPCWILKNKEGNATWSNEEGVFVFSTEAKAKEYIKNTGLEGAVPAWLTWKKLVRTIGGSHEYAIIDHSGKAGFGAIAPLTLDS